MKKCEFKDGIDEFLLNRLSEERKEKFDEHMFNCPSCFQEIQERDKLFSTVKTQGKKIFSEYESSEKRGRVPFYELIFSSLSHKQWALSGVAAALVMIVVFAALPRLKTNKPQFFINEDLVRGGSISLISPVLNIHSVPSQFRWKREGTDVEYKIYIYNHVLLWSATTFDNFISIPENIKNRISLGEQYSWQVKAFSPEGTLVAVSSKVRFMVKKMQK